MIWAVVGAVSVAMAVAARPPAKAGGGVDKRSPPAHLYRSAAEAVNAALAAARDRGAGGVPVVVAFGEYHQTAATAHIPSALHRFTHEILPALSPALPGAGASAGSLPGDGRRANAAPPLELSHLVVETWIATGRCGEAERAVTEDVPKTTQRPAATEGEIETLLRTAAAHHVAPRVLSVSCADYQAMRSTSPDGSGAATVDYDRVLRTTARALEQATLAALRQRRDQPATSRAVAVYGGALHNDVDPDPSLAPYSFAPALLAATLGQFVEIDLVVPEYAAASPALRAQPWWPLYLRAVGVPRRVGLHDVTPVGVPMAVMMRRGPRSFVIVFPRTSDYPISAGATQREDHSVESAPRDTLPHGNGRHLDGGVR